MVIRTHGNNFTENSDTSQEEFLRTETMFNFAERLKHLIDTFSGGSIRRFAGLVGIPTATFYEYVKGKLPIPAHLIRIANYTGYSVDWLLTGRKEAVVPEAPIIRRIPILKALDERFPNVAEEDIMGYVTMPEASEDSYAVVMQDESMAPAVKPGDYVIFIPDVAPHVGDSVIAADAWGNILVRKYGEREGIRLLYSHNPEWPTIEVGATARIYGRVVDVWRRVKV
jgi:SOS-response transcriptional repressor LexA